MSVVISIANQKGGVGKTTCTVNLGLSFAEKGYKCLFIDLDPQNNLGKSLASELAFSPTYLKSRSNVFNMFETASAPTPFEFMDNAFIIAGDKRLSKIGQDDILNFAEALEPELEKFDYVFIDCPPSASALQHAALLVSNKLLVVTQPQKMSIEGVEEITKTARQIRWLNPDLEITGIVINLYESRATKDQEKNTADLYARYGKMMFKNKLGRTVRVSEALNIGKALFQTNDAAAKQFGFTAVSSELQQRIGGVTNE